MDDDLTHKQDIIKFNNINKKQIEKSTRKEIIDDWTIRFNLGNIMIMNYRNYFNQHRSGNQ